MNILAVDAIAVLVPVLGRPANIAPLMASVASATPQPHRLLFIANEGDTDELAALDVAGADFIVVPAARRSWACKINDGYRATTEPWIFTGADDLAFRPDWLPRALAWASDTTGVVGTNDMCNPRVMCGEHSTHSLFRRTYLDAHGTIDQPGVVMHEGYGHDYSDDEAVGTAKARGVYVHAFDALVEHLHPMVGKAENDATYRLGRAQSPAGKRLFQQRRKLWQNPTPQRRRTVTIITASYGGVDTVLHPQADQDIPCEWICYTDQPGLTGPAPWRVVVAPADETDPVFAAKRWKATPTAATTDAIWIDASHQITSRTFAREALAARHDGVAAFSHPRRDCIYTECDASLGAESQGGKYQAMPLREQVAAYRAEGHPEHAGLWACGVVAWDLTNPQAVELGKAWLAENEKWSTQDQLSFPVVARRLGITPGYFPVRQIERPGRGFLANRWLRIHNHVMPAPTPEPVPQIDDVTVVIPFASDDPDRRAAFDYIVDRYRTKHPSWQVVIASPEGAWSKGDALHRAVQDAAHDILVVADADSYVDAATLNEAAVRARDGAAWVMPHSKVHRQTAAQTHAIYQGGSPALRGMQRPPYMGVLGGGIVVLTRTAWDTVGGIDPRFLNWGGEDLSFALALNTLVGPCVRLQAPLIHLYHQLEPRGAKRVGGPENTALWQRYAAAKNNPDAMRALIGEAKVPA